MTYNKFHIIYLSFTKHFISPMKIYDIVFREWVPARDHKEKKTDSG